MARRYEKTLIKYETEKLIQTTCDLCGIVAKRGEWQSSTYEVNEVDVSVTVRQKEGEAYPEGGSGTEYKVDICPECFKSKLIPFLKSEGAVIDEQEWEF